MRLMRVAVVPGDNVIFDFPKLLNATLLTSIVCNNEGWKRLAIHFLLWLYISVLYYQRPLIYLFQRPSLF